MSRRKSEVGCGFISGLDLGRLFYLGLVALGVSELAPCVPLRPVNGAQSPADQLGSLRALLENSRSCIHQSVLPRVPTYGRYLPAPNSHPVAHILLSEIW